MNWEEIENIVSDARDIKRKIFELQSNIDCILSTGFPEIKRAYVMFDFGDYKTASFETKTLCPDVAKATLELMDKEMIQLKAELSNLESKIAIKDSDNKNPP